MAEERVQRRLAAILAADVVGYSRLMGADEEGTLAALKAHRCELIDPTIEAHDGRIVKTAGDGLLIEFSSVVNALRCCLLMQREMIVRNKSVPLDSQFRFRVGINLGDIIVDDEKQTLQLEPGMLMVVPQACWHRFRSQSGVTVLTATPRKDEEHTFVDDPRGL